MTIQIRRTRTPNLAPIGLAPGQLAIEMASNPPRLWCGVPSSIDPSGRILLGAIGAGAPASVKTGDTKLTLKTYAQPGWVMMDDGTIGDAESGASNRAHDDCEALFRLLWGFPNTSAPVVGGRGESATEDWGAHKEITLTRQRGRALVIAGTGAGLTARNLGSYFGAETETQSGAKMASHGHAVADPSHNHGGAHSGNTIAPSHAYSNYAEAAWYPHYWGGHFNAVHFAYSGYGHVVGFNGSSAPFNITQPSAVWNLMVKL